MREIKKAVPHKEGEPEPEAGVPEEVQLVPKKGARTLTRGTKVTCKMSANSQASLQQLSEICIQQEQKYVPAPCGLQ